MAKSKKRDIIEIIAAFAVAWVFYQGLGYATGTGLPIVSVVSESMYHTDGYDGWWQLHGSFYDEIGIEKNVFRSYTLPNGMSKGDLLFVVKPENIHVGDIVLYQRDITIVHRIVKITENGYVTKGDNNFRPDPEIRNEQVVGKVVADVPALGYPRLLLFVFGI
ncbi:MAG TPA: signal peptidase I [archaeon]|nr:signal peptidase I [archaeon]